MKAAQSAKVATVVAEVEPEYDRHAYNLGWHYAGRGKQAVVYLTWNFGNSNQRPEWFDGYFDRRAGREKWFIPLNLDEYVASGQDRRDNDEFVQIVP